jgi:hypothetical protein
MAHFSSPIKMLSNINKKPARDGGFGFIRCERFAIALAVYNFQISSSPIQGQLASTIPD